MLGLLLLLAGSSAKADYPISPVPFTQVRLEGGLLGDRQKINRSATLRHLLKQNEATGRNENFKAAVEEIVRLKPSSSKGRYIQKGAVSTTFGPGIPLDVASLA